VGFSICGSSGEAEVRITIPNDVSLSAQGAFRQIDDALAKLNSGNLDLRGRKVVNAGKSSDGSDYVTRQELQSLQAVASTTINVSGGESVAGKLASLKDVLLSTPKSGQLLTYNGSVWVNSQYVDKGVLYSVSGSVQAGAGLTFDPTGVLTIKAPTGAAVAELVMNTTDATGYLLTYLMRQNVPFAYFGAGTSTTGDIEFATYAVVGGHVSFYTQGTGRMRIDGAGGFVSMGPGGFFAGVVALQVRNTVEQLRLDYDASHYASFTVTSNGYLNIAPSGSRLGVLTAAPGYPLDVTGDINTSTIYRIGGTSRLSATAVSVTTELDINGVKVVGAQAAATADATQSQAATSNAQGAVSTSAASGGSAPSTSSGTAGWANSTDKATVTTAIGACQTAIGTLSTNCSNLKTGVNGLVTDVTKHTTDINGLRTDVISVQTQLNALLAKLRTHGLIHT
jgi:hypothetical protein